MLEYHIDCETYSAADLKHVGAHEYARHPSTEIMLFQWGPRDSDEVHVHDFTSGEPAPIGLRWLLAEAAAGRILLHAFNATFERQILQHVWGLTIPVQQFRCTMVHAYTLAFSGGLAAVGQQMGMPAHQAKLTEGRKLIQRFCKPAPPSHKAARYDRLSHPEEWAAFIRYARADVVAERAISRLLGRYPVRPEIWQLWFVDQAINDRGVPVDPLLIGRAIEATAQEKDLLKFDMRCMTGLPNPASVPQLTGWLASKGVAVEDLTAETLAGLSKREDLADEVLTVIEMKQQHAKTSTAKFLAFLRASGGGDRVRGMFQFGGASRTLRWAGRIVQLQNLPRGTIRDPVAAADALCTQGHAGLIPFGPVMDTLASILRCTITAPVGRLLVVCDLSSIESRVVGWIAGCPAIVDTFAAGRDTYKVFATEYFRVAYEEVTKAQRNFSKPPVLGCSYRLGPLGLIDYAAGMGVTLTEEESRRAVGLWRELHPEVVSLWAFLDDAMMAVILGRDNHVSGYRVEVWRDEQFLFIRLPSGRNLCYYKPEIRDLVPPWGMVKPPAERRTKPTVTFMGVDKSNQWTRITSHGGKACENICQAIAADILGYQMRCAEPSPLLELVGHVHDEMIVSCEEANAGRVLAGLQRLMSSPPDWAPDLLLGAAGFITKRYRKD